MPIYKPETSLRKKIEALERHKAIADALIGFIKAHPDMTAEATLIELHGKVGLRFPDYAVVVPTWKGRKQQKRLVLRLLKSGDDWRFNMGPEEYFEMDKLIMEDVTGVSSDELEAVLNRLYREANPDEDEGEDADED